MDGSYPQRFLLHAQVNAWQMHLPALHVHGRGSRAQAVRVYLPSATVQLRYWALRLPGNNIWRDGCRMPRCFAAGEALRQGNGG